MTKFFLILLIITFNVYPQNNTTCDLINKINKIIQNDHFKPKPVDDSLSVYVFDTFLDALDPERDLFLKSEYDTLSKYKFTIDDAILNNDCSFLDEILDILKKSLLRQKEIIEKIEKESIDYKHNKDTIRFSREKISFYLDENNIETVLRKKIRFAILEDITKTVKKFDSSRKKDASLEKITKEKILTSYLCKINNILENYNSENKDIINTFYNIYCSYFDPHTAYFSSNQKSSFLSSLASSNYSTGLFFNLNDNQEIFVEEIASGSFASLLKKITIGDQLIKVQDDKNNTYWVSCMTLDNISDILTLDIYKEMILTLRKKNGIIYDVKVQKQIMRAEDHVVYSFILKKGKTRIGYINIPSFYSNFDGDDTSGCAYDVFKEVVKLKNEKIEGLIIDLKNNTGGSMEETIKLSGMFIDFGPLSILVDNKNNHNIIADYNVGSIYEGPLIILTNGYTASASEFFVASMQDYNRAIILGTNSLGKASMQGIMPIEESFINDSIRNIMEGNNNSINQKTAKKEDDYIKVTVEKFYRITGKSHQKIGIKPDIFLPNIFNDLIQRESHYKTALENDNIRSNTHFIKYPDSIIRLVIQNSQKRIDNDTYLNKIIALNNKIDKMVSTQESLVINFKNVFKYVHNSDQIWKEINQTTAKENNITVLNTASNKKALNVKDTFKKNINKNQIKSIKKNSYLNEGMQIIKDYNTYFQQQ